VSASGVAVFSCEFVFTSVPRSTTPTALELQLITTTPSLVSSKVQARSLVLPAVALADKGSAMTAGWAAFEGGAEVKISLFWRAAPGVQSPTGEGTPLLPAGSPSPSPPAQQPPAQQPPAQQPPAQQPPAQQPRSPSMRPSFLRRLTSSEAQLPPIASASTPTLSTLVLAPDNSFESSSRRARLTVTVHQARRLKSANLAGGSDPYVGVSVRGTRFKTKVVRSTVDPVWNETFTFGQVEDLDAEDEVSLVIKDWDQLGRNHDLGQVVFPLTDLLAAAAPTAAQPTWYAVIPTAEMRMKSATRGEALGEIQLSIDCALSGGADDDDDVAVSPIALDLVQEPVARPRLVVRIVQARGLPACDSNGKSDPYIVASVAQERLKTKPRAKTLCPVFDCEFVFGAKSLLDMSDELRLTCMDSDLGPGTLFDDLIGELVLPLYALPRHASEPRWYALSSKDFAFAGEVQVAAHVEMPPASVDIYKGKVWLYSLQATVLEARGLAPTDAKTRTCDAYVKLDCGRDGYKTKVVPKTVNPVWQEVFLFKHPAEGEREGLGRGDVLKVRVKSQGFEVGQVALDVASLADKMGYIDPQGKRLTLWFDLEPGAAGGAGAEADGGAGEDATDDVAGALDGDTDSQPSTGLSSRLKLMPSMVGMRRPARTLSGDGAPASPGSATAAVTAAAAGDGGAHGLGQVRLRLFLQPCAETRAVMKKSVVLRVESAQGAVCRASEAVYCTAALGYDALDTTAAVTYRHLPQCPARMHNTLIFDNAEWMLAEAAKWRALRAKAARRRGASAVDLGPAPDALSITVKDADSDAVLGEVRTTLHEAMQAASARFVSTSGGCEVALSASLSEYKGEMVPLLGHVHVALLQFKSYAAQPAFKSSLRFVMRYGAREVASPVFAADPHPRLSGTQAHFAVYNVFTPLQVDVFEDKTPVKGPHPGRLLSLLRGSSATTSTTTTPAAAAATATTLLGTVSLSLFEMVEFEAKTLFEVEAVTKTVEEHAVKLPVKDDKGAVLGSLWLSARYREYFAGVLTANPNPPSKVGKPFSFANFRHEVNRLVAAAGWLSDFGKHVGRILDWENAPTTVFVMSVFVVVCCLDWFASRFLALFPFCMLVHMVNRHRARANGDFLIPFEEAEDAESQLEAEVRVAVLSASLRGAAKHGDVPRAFQCRVSLVKDVAQPRSRVQIGWTRIDANVMDGKPDFARSRAGYGVSFSKSARPSLQPWRITATSDPVTAFDLRVVNETAPPRLLELTLRHATGLLAADSNGLSDPFCHVTMDGAVLFRTGVRPKTLNPVFNERFVLGAKKPLLPGDVIVIQIFDSDGQLAAADKLGSVELPVRSIEQLFMHDEGDGVAFKVRPPPKEAKTDCGSLFISAQWLDVRRVPGLDGSSVAALEQGGSGGDEGDEVLAPDSWTKCGTAVVVDLYEMVQDASRQRSKSMLLGQATVPVAALVETDEQRAQPVREFALQLDRRYDGSKQDPRHPVSGTLKLACQVHLPDPRAKERRLALAAAKKADKASALSKLRTVNQQLSKVQNALFNLNNRLERMKNVFNWTHPRKTKLFFNLMCFLLVFFIVVPTRFVVLAVVLFFMTEHFRPLGTMGARFKHLVAQLPTDDDLRAVVQGELMSGKRAPVRRRDAAAQSPRHIVRHMSSQPGEKPARPSAAALKQITPGDALMAGHMSVLANDAGVIKLVRGGGPVFTRRFFVLSQHGLHFWADKDSSEVKEPLGHIVPVDSAVACAPADVAVFAPGAEHLGGFLHVTSDGTTTAFFCSSARKRDRWVDALRATAAAGGSVE